MTNRTVNNFTLFSASRHSLGMAALFVVPFLVLFLHILPILLLTILILGITAGLILLLILE